MAWDLHSNTDRQRMTPESRVQPKIRDNRMKMLILWRREWTRTWFGYLVKPWHSSIPKSVLVHSLLQRISEFIRQDLCETWLPVPFSLKPGQWDSEKCDLSSEISSWAQKKPEAPRGKEGQWKHSQEDSSQRIVHSWVNRKITPLGVNGHMSIFSEFCSKVLTEEQVGEPH